MKAQLIRGLSHLSLAPKGCVVTIGNFDGVHVGHQALLAKVSQYAHRLQLPALAITFEPQPLEYFAPDKCMPRLTRWREKYVLLAQSDIDGVLMLKFNRELAALTAEQFVQDILYQGLGVKAVMVGDDFQFGRGREGNFAYLQASGEQLGFHVEKMESVCIGHERVSSTLVREALKNGDHVRAERFLGRPYSMLGRVVHGNKLGRVLGFPTANIHLHRAVTPVQGIYIVRMHGLAEKGLPGVANVGLRPTVGGTRILLEVHLFNFDKDLYGRQVQVEFCEKIRDEEWFENLELLKMKIGQDAQIARHYFEERGEL